MSWLNISLISLIPSPICHLTSIDERFAGSNLREIYWWVFFSIFPLRCLCATNKYVRCHLSKTIDNLMKFLFLFLLLHLNLIISRSLNVLPIIIQHSVSLCLHFVFIMSRTKKCKGMRHAWVDWQWNWLNEKKFIQYSFFHFIFLLISSMCILKLPI